MGRTYRARTKLQADPSRNLPAGRLDITLSVDAASGVRVQAMYLGLESRGKVASSHALDDGRVVVDLSQDGKVLGVEFLARKAPKQLPEFRKFIGDSSEALLLAFIATTAMHAWKRSERLLEAITRKLASEEPWADERTIDKDLLSAVC